ncbi:MULTISPECIES: hydrogen peroxide-inducible genes activator [Mycobacterium]|uniref:Probable hydrogen peroxide-inducible genes activator n=3 Tax=Mycobacterium kiyosense TaxID=2871094 RepID=A0A9P3Q3A3_9MYCO|nr:MULTISPECIES: hydrogen peroxide-inducible genes activator [Mycobacterium]BDB42528.1 putative hydrogen peroxide-inducible genes activator [Mycobacterium kiyosense]BDE14211.1 putative hydrogen peroxide-inducible genes activator [Mycobacterium sp. 20KCMC460]GLB81573.1 putative hydrogen peroxide-inducible genes activator [Mycobacterium kiyosense]GLB89115.1 putative hydrogen peroxide-inducible genes activator [Mycobacterium kiyosense]GLB93766.1 putative hydrogen peroxide-inducible genes activato
MPDKSFQPTLAGLRAFVAVAERQHFGSAATLLRVSQSTLSQALAGLETGLGIRLVERSTRRVTVTAEGAELLPFARAVVDAAEAFAGAATGTSDPLRGRLRLGLIPTVAPYVLPTILAGLAGELPELTLQVVEDQTERLLRMLGDSALDAALIALPAQTAGIAEIPIYDEDFVLVLPPGHRLSGKRRVPAAALPELPLLLLDEGHCLRDQTLDVCRQAGGRAQPADTRAASLATAVQCVAGGLGVTLIPHSAVAVETARTRLGLAHFAAPRPGRRIGLVYRATSGHEEPYRRLAGIIGTLIAGEHRVRLVDERARGRL